MKRVFVTLSVLAVMTVAVVGALPLLVSSTTVRTAVLDHLQELTGRDVTIRGNPAISFSPFFAIELDDLAISDPLTNEDDPPLLRVSKVQARIEILPALLGKIQFGEYRLLSPRLNLKVYPEGISNWEFEQGLLHEAVSKAQQNANTDKPAGRKIRARLGNFDILDGAVQYENLISGVSREVTGINVNLNWPEVEGALFADGSGIWRGENIELSTSIGSPVDLMAGGDSEISFALQSTPLQLDFEGNANMISSLFLQGQVSLESPSTRRISEFLEAEIGDFGSLSIAGDLEATSQSMRLTNARLGIASNSAQGAVSLSFDEIGNSKIDGTLAFDTLDFSTLFTEQTAAEGEAQIADQTKNTQIDLRISANAVDAGFMRLSEVAAILTADPEGWAVDIGDSSTFGGNLIAKFGERIQGENKEGFLDATSTGIESQELSALFSNHKIRIAGKSAMKMNLRGDNIRDVLSRRKINGFFEARFEEGSIDGIDLPRLLSNDTENEEDRSERLELGSETRFTGAETRMFITNSIATIAKSSVQADEMVIRLFGRIDLRQGNLSLRALQVTDDGQDSERLFLGGTLRDPLVSLKPTPSRPSGTCGAPRTC